jgi:hypothetical protein
MDSARRFRVVPAVTITFSQSLHPARDFPKLEMFADNIVGIRALIVFLSCSKG